MAAAVPTAQPQPKRAPRISLRSREAIEAYVLMAPAVIGFLVFTHFPMVASLGLSFTEYDLLSSPEWIGLENYKTMIHDEFFWKTLKVTGIYAGISLPLGLVVALVIAMLLNQRVPGLTVWRTVYVLPSVVSGVSVAMLWQWIFNAEFGLINSILDKVGVTGPDWLGTTTWALPSLILIGLWGIGQTMLIYLAGLQGVPSELYEAVEVDGGNAWNKFRNVTLPMLSPIILFNLVTGVIYSFQYFTETFLITQGGPENSTLFYLLYLYRNAFEYLDMGYASALAWVSFMVVLVLTILVFRSTPMWVHYETERGGR